jgi:K+-sensing histidine kinase KdpD
MKAFGQQLASEVANSKLKHKAELVVLTSDLVISQVNFLLDKNLLDQKVFTPHLEKHLIKKVVKDAVSIFEAQASAKKLTIDVKFEGENRTLMLDQMRIHQIMLNLMSNATKFS